MNRKNIKKIGSVYLDKNIPLDKIVYFGKMNLHVAELPSDNKDFARYELFQPIYEERPEKAQPKEIEVAEPKQVTD